MKRHPSTSSSFLLLLLLSSCSFNKHMMMMRVGNAQIVVESEPLYDPCAICGPGRSVVNPFPFQITTTAGDLTCIELQFAGLDGRVANCPADLGLVLEEDVADIGFCFCSDLFNEEGGTCNICGDDTYLVFNPNLTVNVTFLTAFLSEALDAGDFLSAFIDPLLELLGFSTFNCRQWFAFGALGFLPGGGEFCTNLTTSAPVQAVALACGCAPESFGFLTIVFDSLCASFPFLCGGDNTAFLDFLLTIYFSAIGGGDGGDDGGDDGSSSTPSASPTPDDEEQALIDAVAAVVAVAVAATGDVVEEDTTAQP